MARISSYPYDNTVTDNDAWIGTEASSKRTKQFTAKAVAEYLNLNAKVNIGGQMSFKWSDTENGGTGTISKNGGGGTGGNSSTAATGGTANTGGGAGGGPGNTSGGAGGSGIVIIRYKFQ